MALPAMITGFGEQSANYGAVVGQSLQQLGQQVGQQLAMREYQKQAQAQLPVLQQQMKDAIAAAGAGRSAEAYSKMIGLTANPQVLQNPFMLPALEMGFKAIGDVDQSYRSMEWKRFQERGAGGGGIPAARMPMISDEERARQTLLGGGTSTTDVGFSPNVGTEDLVAVDVTDQEMPVDGVEESTAAFISGPMTEQAAPQEQDQTALLMGLANRVKSKEFKNAIMNAAKNPPSADAKKEAQQYAQQYEALPEDQKVATRDSLSLVVESPKQVETNKNFYSLNPKQQKIVGDGIIGLTLEPIVEAEGTTIGRTESTRWGTNKKALDDYHRTFSGAVQELSMGEIGKFIERNGGVFNLTANPVPARTTTDELGDQVTTPAKIELYGRNLPPTTTDKITITPEQYASFKIIEGTPSEIQRLRARQSNSSIVRIMSKGPVREQKVEQAEQAKERFPVKQGQAPTPAPAPTAAPTPTPFGEQYATPEERERAMTERIRGGIGAGLRAVGRGGEAILRGARAIR